MSNKDRDLRRFVYLHFAVLILAVSYLLLPHRQELPALIFAAYAFGIVQVVFPGCRPDVGVWLTPKNLALGVFVTETIVTPLLVSVFGAEQFVLPFLPTDLSMNVAILINVLAFVSFCAGYHLWDGHNRGRQRKASAQLFSEARRSSWKPSVPTAFAFAIVGVAGIVLQFGDTQAFLGYLSDPGQRLLWLMRPSTVSIVLGRLMRQFLGYSVAIFWTSWMDARAHRLHSLLVALVTGICLILTVIVSLDFNRAAFFVPILVYLAVFSARLRRVSLFAIASIVVVSVVLVFAFGSYRQAAVDSLSLDPESIIAAADLQVNVQVYFWGPQFLGYFMEKMNYGLEPFWGRTLLASALQPIPILGGPFRDFSGPALYNQTIYGPSSTAADQIVPFAGELMVDFNLLGVIAGYLLLGIIMWNLEHKFLEAQQGSAIIAYCWFIISYWAAFLIGSSLSIFSQVMINAFWPIWVLFALRSILSRRERPVVVRLQDTTMLLRGKS